MAHFIVRHADGLTSVRTQLLHGLAAHFDKSRPDGAEIGDAVWAMAAVRRNVPANRPDDGGNAWADAAIVRRGQVQLSPQLSKGVTYTRTSFAPLVQYRTHESLTPPEHALLRNLATRNILGIDAFETTVALKDPADLQFIGGILANLSGIVWANYGMAMDKIVATFGVHAAPMLRIFAVHAQDYQLRDQAAFHLILLGQADGESVIAQSLQSSIWNERRSAADRLDVIFRRHVPLGSLAQYCTQPDGRDPCGASISTTPPGECGTGLPCMTPQRTLS